MVAHCMLSEPEWHKPYFRPLLEELCVASPEFIRNSFRSDTVVGGYDYLKIYILVASIRLSAIGKA